MDLNNYNIKLINADQHPSQLNPYTVYKPSEFKECNSNHKAVCGIIPDSKNMIHLDQHGNIQIAKHVNNKIISRNYKWNQITKLPNSYFNCE